MIDMERNLPENALKADDGDQVASSEYCSTECNDKSRKSDTSHDSSLIEEKVRDCSDEKLTNNESGFKFDKNDAAGDSRDDEEDENDDNYDDEERERAENDLSSKLLEDRLQEAQTLKDKGNTFYRTSELAEAVECYSTAIETCAVRNKKERAIYFSNRAACFVKMENYKKAIKDCSKALDLNSSYLKARLRRAQCYEHEDRLEEALEDYQKVFESDKSNDIAREAVLRLPDQIKEKHEKLKEEMFGKLKDLGNLFLKPFGLSTENFQMQQDTNTGGYSINFKK